MPPETTQSITKRLPACDSCKFRRIRCFPVLPPDACSCCKAKDIVCTTTPVIRKKPKNKTGKHIEIAKQQFGTMNYASPSAPEEVASTISERAHRQSTSPSFNTVIGGITKGLVSDYAPTSPAILPAYARSQKTLASSSASPPIFTPPYRDIISVPNYDSGKESAAEDIKSSRNADVSLYRDYTRSPLPYISAESGLINTEFSGALLADLLYLYTRVPRSRFLPCLSVLSSFEMAGRRLTAIPPVTQTLVLTIAAMTARLSSNPTLFGSGRAPPALSSLYFNPHRLVTEFSPEWGSRREAACETLREMAIEKAWSVRVITENSPQSLAVCFILQFLEDQLGSARDRRMWATAFVQQLRVMFERRAVIGSDPSLDGPVGPAITESLRSSPHSAIPMFSPPAQETPNPSPEQITAMTQLRLANTFSPPSWFLTVSMDDPVGSVQEPHISDMGLRWCIQIMREALISAARSESCSYTMHDEIMLVGPPPPSPEEVVSGAFNDLPWWDFGSLLLFVRPFTYRATQIALESIQWQLRRLNGQPFSLSRLEEHLSSLSSLHTLMTLIQARYSNLFSPEALTIRYQALCLSTPNMADDERDLRFWLMNRNILYTSRVFLISMKSAFGTLNIPIYLDLLARLRALEAQQISASGIHQATGQRQGVDSAQQLAQLLRGLKSVLLPYAREVLHDIQTGANLGWITHLGNEPLKLWCGLILESTPIEDGGEGITRAQRAASLETAVRIFKILTWSWPRVFDDPLILRTQQVVEEDIRNGVYSSSSMADHVPRSSFGIDPLASSPQYLCGHNYADEFIQGPGSASYSSAEQSENSGIWPSYLGLEEAWRVMESLEAASLKTVHTADAIPAMPWPKVYRIPSTLDLPDIREMMQGLMLHGGPMSGPMVPPPSPPPVTSAPASNAALHPNFYGFAETAPGNGFNDVQTRAQMRNPAQASMQMPDLSEFGGLEGSVLQPPFDGHSLSQPDLGLDMRDFAHPSLTGWVDQAVNNFWF